MGNRHVSLGPGFTGAGIILLILSLVALVDGAANMALSLGGRVAMTAASAFSLFLFSGSLVLKVELGSHERHIFTSFLFFIVVYTTSLILNSISIRGIERVVQLSVVSSFFIMLTLLSRDTNILSILNIILYIISAYILANILWLLTAYNGESFSGIFSNPNVMAMSLLVIVGLFMIAKNFAMNAKKYMYYAFIVLACILIYYTKSRSAFLTAIIFFMTYYGFPKIRASKFIQNTVFLFVIFFPVVVLSLFVVGGSFGYLPLLKDLSVTIFDKPTILNERVFLWTNMIDIIADNILLGVGPHAVPSTYLDTSLSSHNHYIQTALQVGLIGLLSMVYILWLIWVKLCRVNGGNLSRVSAAFLLSLIFHQMFEVVLFQNNIPIALGMWSVVSVGLGGGARFGSEI